MGNSFAMIDTNIFCDEEALKLKTAFCSWFIRCFPLIYLCFDKFLGMYTSLEKSIKL